MGAARLCGWRWSSATGARLALCRGAGVGAGKWLILPTAIYGPGGVPIELPNWLVTYEIGGEPYKTPVAAHNSDEAKHC